MPIRETWFRLAYNPASCYKSKQILQAGTWLNAEADYKKRRERQQHQHQYHQATSVDSVAVSVVQGLRQTVTMGNIRNSRAESWTNTDDYRLKKWTVQTRFHRIFFFEKSSLTLWQFCLFSHDCYLTKIRLFKFSSLGRRIALPKEWIPQLAWSKQFKP